MLSLPSFLPGRLSIRVGNRGDYQTLASFHYLPNRPATFATIAAIDYAADVRCLCPCEQEAECAAATMRIGIDSPPAGQTIAVGVLSWPVPACKAREQHFGLLGQTRSEKIVWANQNIRTVSRVIVHPQFRSLGLSTILVDWLCQHCDTRYIESMARMGNAHPFFQRAGFTRIDGEGPDAPVYFLKDRGVAQRIAA